MNKAVRILNNNLKKIDDLIIKTKEENIGGYFLTTAIDIFEIGKDKLEDIVGITEDRKKNGY